jgi:hypothetical protein
MILIIITFIVLIYIYSLKLSHPDYPIVTYNDIKHKVKSGDLVLFVSLDTINQLYMGSYYTHIGVVYRPNPMATPVLVESFNNFKMPFYPKDFSTGVATCDLETRMNTYRGFIVYKELAKPITEQANLDFLDFIAYARANMKYDYNVVLGEVGKILFNTPFTNITNCGQFTTLILIKLNLLDLSHFKNRQKHHLVWTSNLQRVKNNYYRSPVYIYSEYFKVPIQTITS